MSAPVKATVTPEDTKAAHEICLRLVVRGTPACPKFSNAGYIHSEPCTAIAQALANARETGRREAFGEALDALGHPDARNIIVGLSRAARRAHIVAAEASMSVDPQKDTANRPDTSIATPSVEVLVKALERIRDSEVDEAGRCRRCAVLGQHDERFTCGIASRALAEYGKAGT